MSPDKMLHHHKLLEDATKAAGRKLSSVELYRMGILLYESKKDCPRHKHNIKRFGSFACPNCENDYATARRELEKMEKLGMLTKIHVGKRVMWAIGGGEKA